MLVKFLSFIITIIIFTAMAVVAAKVTEGITFQNTLSDYDGKHNK